MRRKEINFIAGDIEREEKINLQNKLQQLSRKFI